MTNVLASGETAVGVDEVFTGVLLAACGMDCVEADVGF